MSYTDRAILISEIEKLLPKAAKLNNANYDPIEFVYSFLLSVCRDVDKQEETI